MLRTAILTIGGTAILTLLFLWGMVGDHGAKRGTELYAKNCASCHGANLQGQADWQTRLPTGKLPAPPHDASGHTWHHPDGVLLRIVKEGTAGIVGGGYESDMPGFAGVLSDAEIEAVLEFIKSTWPEHERRYQEELSRREQTAR